MGVPFVTAESTSAMPTSTRIPAGRALGPFDLIEVARIVVIDGRPEERGEVAQLRVWRDVYRMQLVHGIGGNIWEEAMREHFLARRGDEVEVVGDHGKLRGYQNSRGLFELCAGLRSELAAQLSKSLRDSSYAFAPHGITNNSSHDCYSGYPCGSASYRRFFFLIF